MEKGWRRFVHLFHDGDPPEVKEFKTLVEKCNNDDDIKNCFDFFSEKFSNIKSAKDIKYPGLDDGIQVFFDIFFSFFKKSFLSFPKRADGFNFIVLCLDINKTSKEFIKNISDFVLELIKMEEEVDEMANFIQITLNIISIQQNVLATSNLPDIFVSVFTKNTKKVARSIVDAFSKMVYKPPQDNFKMLYDIIISSVKDGKINDCTLFFEFASFLYKHSKNTDIEFFDQLFVISKSLFFSLKTFDFYANFLLAPKSEKVYSVLNSLINNDNFPKDLLNSSILVLYKIPFNSMKWKLISFDGYLRRGSDIIDENQTKLFDLFLKMNIDVRKEIFQKISPPYKFHFNSLLFLNLYQTLFNYDEIANIFLIPNSQSQEFLNQCINDKNISSIVCSLCSLVSKEKACEVTSSILSFASVEDDFIETALNNILSTFDPKIISNLLIKHILDGKATGQIYEILGKFAIKNYEFVKCFFLDNFSNEGELSLHSFFQNINSIKAIDFLADLVSNGPYSFLDNFISTHFHDTYLKSLNNNQLINLALGLPHDSQSLGVLRIPSLAKFVDIPLNFPYDRYIFGKTIYENNMKVDKRCYRQYLSKKCDRTKLFYDPQQVYDMVKGKNPFKDIYQLHMNMPHAVAKIKTFSTIGFWFRIKKIMGRTILLSSGSNTISFDFDGIRIFDDEPINCSINDWHMIVIITQSRNFQITNFVSVYLDSIKITDKFIQLSEYLEIGSEDDNHSIWYISSDFLINKESLPISEIQSLNSNYSSGNLNSPNIVKYPLECQPGFRFVKYKGIGRYLTEFGGQEYVFMNLLNYNTENNITESETNNFLLWIKCAFSFLNRGIITSNFFNQALKYIIIQKSYLINEKIQEYIINSLDENGFFDIYGDLQILSMPNINVDFLKTLFSISTSQNTCNIFIGQLFDLILEAYIILDPLTDSTRKALEKGINSFVAKYQESIEKVLVTAASLHKLNNEDEYSIEESSDNPEKIKFLFNVATNDMKIFKENIAFHKALDILSILPHMLHDDYLIFLAKVCNYYCSYYDYKSLKSHIPLFVSFYKNQYMWMLLLSILTSVSFNNINDFSSAKIVDQKSLKIILNVISIVMSLEIQFNPDDYNNFISFKVFNIILKIVQDNTVFLNYPTQIERLCSLGFNDDFDILKNSDFNQKFMLYVYNLNKSWFNKATLSYIEKEKNKKSFEQLNLSKEISEDILEKIVKTETIQSVISIASHYLISISKASLFNKKSFSKMVGFIRSYNSHISNLLKKAIIFHILKSKEISDSDESLNQFFNYISMSLFEKIWSKSELIEILISSLKFLKSKHKSFKSLAFIIIMNLPDIEDKINSFCLLYQNKEFLNLIKEDSDYFIGINQFLLNAEVTKSPNYEKLIEIVSRDSDIKSSEFGQALLKNKLLIWFASQNNIYDEIKTNIEKQYNSSKQTFFSFKSDTKSKSFKIPNFYEIKSISNFSNLLIRKATRFQIFYHVNEFNYKLEDVIIKIFRKMKQIDFILHPPQKFMMTRAPNPLTVPQKFDPLIFSFSIPFKKTHRVIPLERSSHSPNFGNICLLEEICLPRCAALCLKNWKLPPYCSVAAVRPILEKLWSSSDLLKCSILTTPEILPCICSIGQENFYILTNATFKSKKDNNNTFEDIILPESSNMLCHFEAFEAGAYGMYGTTNTTMIFNRDMITLKYSDISIALPRRYAYSEKSVDIFTIAGNHFTIIFQKENDRKQFMSKIKYQNMSTSDCQFGMGFSFKLLNVYSLDHVTKMWTLGNLSTFDYLLYLNIHAGRSFNDPSQYPIFPWILSNYSSDIPTTTRDLSKPMGAQTEPRKQRFLQTYNETSYHYGTHYSHSAAILHYLLRLEPYTFFEIHLHNGWDHKDRLFCSIEEAWKSASDANQADVKELIPEFFCLPIMFENPNNLQLGERTDGLPLEKVKMPKWGTNPQSFVWYMRNALESANNINEWIDLIFGYKQRGQAAIDAINCFQPLSYDDAFIKNKVDVDDKISKKAAVDMINNFGQCPTQLFLNPHPPRTAYPSSENKKIEAESADTPSRTPSKKNLSLFNTKPNIHRTNLLMCSSRYITKLKSTSKVAKTTRVLANGSIYVASNKELFVGNPPKPVKIEDRDVKQFCLSSDGSLFATASIFGFVTVYDWNQTIVSQFLTLCEEVSAIALSSQQGILAIADKRWLKFFDITTGFFMRQTNEHFDSKIISIVFHDAVNFVIVIEKFSIHVLGLDLRLIASFQLNENDSPFTCVATGDSEAWCEEPFFLCGHQNGKCDLFIIDVINSNITSTCIASIESEVSSISIFSDSKAALIFGIDKTLILVSASEVHHMLLENQYYERCALCGKGDGSRSYCRVCGLYVCRNCKATKFTTICSRCQKLGFVSFGEDSYGSGSSSRKNEASLSDSLTD